MKKLLLGFMAVAAMFATSCQQEQNLSVVEAGETSLVSFNLAAPQAASRAYSDGTTATVLLYAIYDAKGEVLTNISNTNEDSVADLKFRSDLTQEIDVQLTTGNTYTAVFWAVSENALNNEIYTIDWTNKKMNINYVKPNDPSTTLTLCNDETRDAFYKHVEFKVKGRMDIAVELKRPFAQINIGTNDYTDAENAGYKPQTSKIYITGDVYGTLNMADGSVENKQSSVTYDFAEIPTTETFPVANYEYLAMAYVLVPETATIVDLTFSYYDQNAYVDANSDERTHERTVGSVPVQRNHRTNLYGQLLTGDITFNVVINPDYDKEDNNQGYEYREYPNADNNENELIKK